MIKLQARNLKQNKRGEKGYFARRILKIRAGNTISNGIIPHLLLIWKQADAIKIF